MDTILRNDQKPLWISYSGISDFETCPRLYYLRNLYTTPVTERRIQVADPYLTLGTAVHRVTEEISILEPKKRRAISLLSRFDRIWQFFSGKRGGFQSAQEERNFYERGKKMIEKLEASDIMYGPSYSTGERLPRLRLFPDKDILLVGSFDWIEVLEQGGFHIIDFKTGKKEEKEDSLQLPIYLVLGVYTLKNPIEKMSYWYLEKDEGPVTKKLAAPESYLPILQEKAIKIKKAVEEGNLVCTAPKGMCAKCEKYERVLSGDAEYVGFDRKMNREIYAV